MPEIHSTPNNGLPIVPEMCPAVAAGGGIDVREADFVYDAHTCTSGPNAELTEVEVVCFFGVEADVPSAEVLKHSIAVDCLVVPIVSELAAQAMRIKHSPTAKEQLREKLCERIIQCRGSINGECGALGNFALQGLIHDVAEPLVPDFYADLEALTIDKAIKDGTERAFEHLYDTDPEKADQALDQATGIFNVFAEACGFTNIKAESDLILALQKISFLFEDHAGDNTDSGDDLLVILHATYLKTGSAQETATSLNLQASVLAEFRDQAAAAIGDKWSELSPLTRFTFVTQYMAAQSGSNDDSHTSD